MISHQTAPAQAPISGRSRFSKALPSVPVFHDNPTPLPPIPYDFENLDLPPPPPPPPHAHKDDDTRSIRSIARKPLQSFPGTTNLISGVGAVSPSPKSDVPSSMASPLPTSSSASSMNIRRRPVGNGVGAGTAGGNVQPVPARSPLRTAPVPAPEPSPTDSINSLLSAYTREYDEPTTPSGSTYKTASSTTDTSTPTQRRESNNRSSPVYHASPAVSAFTPRKSSIGATTTSSRSTVRQVGADAPQPPPKDNGPQPSSPPKQLPAIPATQVSSSPTGAEIWRRRPQHGHQNSKEVPGLRLHESHGSTASISSIQTAVNLAAKLENESKPETPPKTSTPKQRPAVTGLPGRNIRPAAAAAKDEQPSSQQQKNQSQTTGAMGTATSKLKQIKDNFRSSKSSDKAVSGPGSSQYPIRGDSKRPPTPEYRKGDASAPSNVDTVVKPASPVSTAGSPKASDSETPKALPAAPKPAEPTRTGSRPRLGSLPQAHPNLRAATSTPTLRKDDLSPNRSMPSRGESPPSNVDSRGSSNTRNSGDSAASGGSRRLGAQGPGDQLRRPATATGSDPRIVHSDSQGSLYKGRDGTLYAEMKVSGEPDPKATYFPIQTDKPIAPGTIISAKPLRESHYNCFQKHRTMNRRTNRNYPLTCQTCDRADVEDRFVCSFCHLRICEPCLRALSGHQKVLRRLMDQLGTSTPLSLMSSSRPGSALGLELPA